MRSIKVALILALLGSVSLARGPDLFVKKDTKIESYIASMNKVVALEKANGTVIPAPRNEDSLPLVLYSKYFNTSAEGKFRLNVSGVKKLYVGGAAEFRLRNVVLDSGDGTARPLRTKEGKQIVKVTPSGKGRMWWGGAPGEFTVKGSEAVLELDGKYQWISGTMQTWYSVAWIDKTPHLDSYEKVHQMRWRIARSAGFDERIEGPLLPAGYEQLDVQKVAQALADYIKQKYNSRAQVDPVLIDPVMKALANARSGADYHSACPLIYAVVNYDKFNKLRDQAANVKAIPGLIKAFDAKFKKEYYQLDLDKFDYRDGFKAKVKEWDTIIKKAEEVSSYAGVIFETIDFVSKTIPSVLSEKKTVEALQKKMLACADDLDRCFAVYDEMTVVRRRVSYNLPVFDFDSILVNRNPPTTYSHNSDQHLGRHSRIGKGLTILTDWKSGKPKVKTILEGKMPPGAYRNPDLSYDGKRVLFAFCDHTEKNAKLRRFFIYEAAIDGSWVRQLTGTKRDKFKTWDNRATVLIEDNDPCYLPDGGIVFISTRCQSFGRCHIGRWNPAWNLHRCDKDGNNIKQLSFGNENEVEPSVLNDGRILFTRWEYTNRHEMYFHKLWWCRPDGTAVTHFFGNDMTVPHQFVEATVIPGSHKVVCTGQGHHCYNTGTTVVLDTNIDENGEKAIKHITPETPYSETHGWPEPHYSHPYPLSEDIFLVSRANHPVHKQGQVPPVADRAVYVIDSFGARDKIYEDPEVASFSPIPIKPRKRPPVLTSHLKPDAKPYGTLFLQNAYLTRNDPNGVIKPGMIKALRINALGVQPRAKRKAVSMTIPNDIPKKVLGTVPVDKDGSAFFRIPANVSVQIQSLDENGMALLTEKSLFFLQPGERRSCVGCHEPVGRAPDMSSMAKMGGMKLMDLKSAAGPQYKGGMSFVRTVQPVLDRYCIKCHGLEKTEKKVNLVYDPDGYRGFPSSLAAIVERGRHKVGDKGYMNKKYKGSDVTFNISRPRKFYAYENKVSHMLVTGDKNHPKLAETDRESYMRIIEWLDLNGQCYGDMFPNKMEERRFNKDGLKALRSYAKELFGEKIASQPEYALVNLVQPDESRILMMALPVSKGGWGQIKVFKSKGDASYKKMAELVEGCISRKDNENTNGWEPTWDMGAGEKWVMEARTNYLSKVIQE